MSGFKTKSACIDIYNTVYKRNNVLFFLQCLVNIIFFVLGCCFNKHESLALEFCRAFIGVSRMELKKEVENQNETGGTCSAKVNVFKCRRNSADVGVQVLAGLGYVSLEVRGAANEESNNATPA